MVAVSVLHLYVLLILADVGCKSITGSYCSDCLEIYISLYKLLVKRCLL